MPPERDHVRVNDQGVWYKSYPAAQQETTALILGFR